MLAHSLHPLFAPLHSCSSLQIGVIIVLVLILVIAIPVYFVAHLERETLNHGRAFLPDPLHLR